MAQPSRRSLGGLDWLNFFIADVQTGFGPFVSSYLTASRWTQVDIGVALSIGTVTSLIGQIPAGALVDRLSSKRTTAVIATLCIAASALMLGIWPAPLPVYAAEVLHGFASCALGPAVAAISLALVGRAALAERLGRNARFASIGNGVAAAVMGLIGYYFASRAVFWLTAALAVPALLMLHRIGRARLETLPQAGRRTPWAEMRTIVLNRRFIVFSAAAMMFHLANAAMLPLAASQVTSEVGDQVASVLIAASIMVPQAVVALVSPWVGRSAERLGRRPMLLLGWGMLPARGVLMAVLPDPYAVVALQALSGISAAVFGIMLPLIAADLTRGTNRFNLCLGCIGTFIYFGATASTSLAGWVADEAGVSAAFLALAAAGLVGTVTIWLLMPETRGAMESPALPR